MTAIKCGHDVARSRLTVASTVAYLFGPSKAAGRSKTDLAANFSCQIFVGWAVGSGHSL